MGTQEPNSTPPLSSDSIPLPPNFRGKRHEREGYNPDANNESGADVQDSLFSLFGESSPLPPPKIQENVRGGKVHFDLNNEEHDFARGPAFHCPEVYNHIEKAKRMGISVGPRAPVFIRYVPPEGHDDDFAPSRSSPEDEGAEEAVSSRETGDIQSIVMTEAEVETEVDAEAALEEQIVGPVDAQVDQLSTEDTRHVMDGEEATSPKGMEDIQPAAATETEQETEIGAQAALVEERTVEATESRVEQLPTETGSNIENVGQRAGEQSDSTRQKADSSGSKSGGETSDRIVQISDAQGHPQSLPPREQSEKDDVVFKRIGKKRLQNAFPKLAPFRRMRTWAGPPPSAPSIRRKSIGGNPLPPHPVFSRPGRRQRGISAQPGGNIKQDPENTRDVPLQSIEQASAPLRGTRDGTTVVADASSVTQPGPSAQQGASRQSSVASTVATRRSTRRTTVAASQRPPSAAPSRQEANTKKKVAKTPARAPKALETVAEESEAGEQDGPDDESKGDEGGEAEGESEDEKEEDGEDGEREPSASLAQKGKRKAPAKAAEKAPAKKKAATTKSKKAVGKTPASKKAAGSKATGKTAAEPAGKKSTAKTTKKSKK